VLAVGYKDPEDIESAPGLLLLHLNWSDGTIRSAFIAKREICSTDASNYSLFRYYIRTVPGRNQFLLGSNLSSEVWLLSMEFSAKGDELSGVFIEEPEDEKVLSITDDGEFLFCIFQSFFSNIDSFFSQITMPPLT
jgi:hypothetical protein